MKHPLQALIDAPLANACKLNLPAGRAPAPRAKKADYGDDIGCPKVGARELRERKKKAEQQKLDALFDYYAATELSAKRVAEHMGLYRQEQVGVDDNGKALFKRVPDIERAHAQLSWRRKAAAA